MQVNLMFARHVDCIHAQDWMTTGDNEIYIKSMNGMQNNVQKEPCIVLTLDIYLINNWPSQGKEGNDTFIWIGKVSPRLRSTDICTH